MVNVIYSGMLSNDIMLVLFRGEYYKVRIQNVIKSYGIVYQIERRYLLEENRIEKE